MDFQFSVPELHDDEERPKEESSFDRRYGEPVFDAMNAGVAPGGLVNRDDIKMLICYMLDVVGSPVSKRMIGDVMQEEELANYFEVMNAISELIEIGNLEETVEGDEEILTLTERGRSAVEVLAMDIPKTVRETAVKSLVHFMTLERNARENEVQITPRDDGGYDVAFTLKDHDFPMMELKIYVADRDQAETLKHNFVEDPVRIYSSILAALMVD